MTADGRTAVARAADGKSTRSSADVAIASDRVGYRGVAGRATTLWRGALAVCRWNLRPLFRRWAFWLLFGLGMLGFFTNFALIYIKAEIAVQNREFARFIDQFRVTGTGEAYRDFLWFQSRAVVLMLAYVGVATLINDFRAGGLSFYLSKPIGRLHYILGKSMALCVVLSTLTLIPGLVLFLAYGFFSNSPQYWLDEWRLVRGIIGYSALIMVFPSLLLLALATLLQRTAPLLLVWTSIFVVVPIISFWVARTFNAGGWRVLSVWYDLAVVGSLCFGTLRNPLDRPFVPWAGVVLAVVAATSLTLLFRNLRAVEVVE